MFVLSETKKRKYSLDPPPPQKKNAQGSERSEYDYTHLCLYILPIATCDTDFY